MKKKPQIYRRLDFKVGKSFYSGYAPIKDYGGCTLTQARNAEQKHFEEIVEAYHYHEGELRELLRYTGPYAFHKTGE